MGKATVKQNNTLTKVDEKQNLPAAITLDDFRADAKAGFENVKTEDVVLPRFSILHKLSPQLDKAVPDKYIEGAEAGQFLNHATGEVTSELHLIPAAYQRRYIEWRKREDGGGLVKDWGEDESIVGKCTHPDPEQPFLSITPDGNTLVTAGTWYCIDARTGKRCFIPLSKSQMEVSRKWMSLATSEQLVHPETGPFCPPLYYRSYILTTVPKSNKKGSWNLAVVERGPTINMLENAGALKDAAKAFHAAVMSGAAAAKAETVAEADSEQTVSDDKIPF